MAAPVLPPPKSIDNITTEQTSVVNSESAKKRILDSLKQISNKNTTLKKPPFSIKPIALLEQLTPFVKVQLKLPKIKPKGTPSSFRNIEFDYIDLFFNPTDAENKKKNYFNNYIKAFEYSYEGGGFKCSLSIVDLTFDFSDMLLLRYRSLEDTNLAFFDVTFGWTSPEYNMEQSTKKGAIFQNVVTFQITEVSEEDSTFDREIKIAGTVVSTFPDGTGMIMPYSILGPYPLITYNFIRYLFEPFRVQLKIMGLIPEATAPPIAAEDKIIPKIPVNDPKAKKEFVQNLYKANMILGKTPLTPGQAFTLKNDIMGTSAGSSIAVEELFPGVVTSAESNLLKKTLTDIFKANKILPATAVSGTTINDASKLNPTIITQIYESESFYSLIKGMGSDSATGAGNPVNKLISQLAPMLKEIRIHPWEAAKYFYYTMIGLIEGGIESKKVDYNFIELDFAGCINYSSTAEASTIVDTVNITKREMRATSKVIGYKSTGADAEDMYASMKNPYLKLFGVPADAIFLNQGTTWDQLINMAITKVKIDLTSSMTEKEKKAFEKQIGGEIGSNAAKAGIKKKLDKKQTVEENNTLFVQQFAGQPATAFKFSNLNSKMFFASSQSRKSIFETLKAMLDKKAEYGNINAVQRINDLNDFIESKGGDDNTERLAHNADIVLNKVLDHYIGLSSKGDRSSLILTIFNDRAGSVFGEGFGDNNIVQAYNVRFKNSRDGFEATKRRSINDGSLNMEFPDVVSFKPTVKNLLTNVREILPLTDMFEVTGEGSGKKVSTTQKQYITTTLANLSARKGELDEKRLKAKTIEERKSIETELRAVISEEKAAADALKSGENIKYKDEINAKTDARDTLKHKERLRFPIRWNSDPRIGNGFLDGDTSADSALMKSSVTNFKRRMIIHSQSYEAELRIIGDATYCGTYFTDKLVFIKSLMADGRDSIHTGIYQITNFSHHISAGSFFTTLKLMKRPDLNARDNPRLMEEMIQSLQENPIYEDQLSKEEIVEFSASNYEEKKKLQQQQKTIAENAYSGKGLTPAQTSAAIFDPTIIL